MAAYINYAWRCTDYTTHPAGYMHAAAAQKDCGWPHTDSPRRMGSPAPLTMLEYVKRATTNPRMELNLVILSQLGLGDGRSSRDTEGALLSRSLLYSGKVTNVGGACLSMRTAKKILY